MSSQNISSFGHHFRRLATLNSNHITDVTQTLALFNGDQARSLQHSKNCIDCEEKEQGGQSHITTHNHTHTSGVCMLVHERRQQTNSEQTGGEEDTLRISHTESEETEMPHY